MKTALLQLIQLQIDNIVKIGMVPQEVILDESLREDLVGEVSDFIAEKAINSMPGGVTGEVKIEVDTENLEVFGLAVTFKDTTESHFAGQFLTAALFSNSMSFSPITVVASTH